MNHSRFLVFIWCLSVFCPVLLLTANDESLTVQAMRLLQAKCISCHGAEEAEGGLRLDSRERMLKGGQRGPAAVEAQADQSLLFKCVTGLNGEELRMPPKNPLSQNEIDVLKRWLNAGAKWSELRPEKMPSTSAVENIGDAWTDERNPIRKIFGGERLGLWSLKPIQTPQLPGIQPGAWCKNEIDYFVAAQFEAAQVALPTQADSRTLRRRIHFDLTGLPPAPEFVEADKEIDQLIDECLGSEHLGIHWARMWLDVARYSDSNGFDWDEFRPQAYRYRDYVIRSFNQDKPYDRFITEQLAGDEMLSGPPQNTEEQDALLATGFLRMGPHDNAAKLFNEQDRSRDELLIDLVETTGGALLGMTMSCCRCHDHKFDPISQADYFRLRACFAGVQFADDLPIDLADVQSHAQMHNASIDEKIATLSEQRKQVLTAILARTESESEASEKSAADIEKALEKPDKIKKSANDEEKQQLEKIEAAIKQASDEKHKLTHAMLMVDAEKPAPTYVLYQGDYKSPRGQVEPGILSILNPNSLPSAVVARPNSSGRRTALARWITAKGNPLTARVLVNRVWQQLMGQGIVRTPGDFGLAGIPPQDRALLDWLATRFVEDGWSIKRLVRTIMQSATYQQAASYKEPIEDLLYATRRPRRLTAEQLRDSMLAVSGLLTGKNSGTPQWPDLPREVLEANPAFLDDNETKTKGWYPSPAQEQNCRSIFLVQKRNTRVPLLETLDQPDNSVCCQRRQSSIVAPQALSLLNSPQSLSAAKSLADRIQSLAETTPQRVHVAYRLALQRSPSASELQACTRLIEHTSCVELARVLFNINEFAYVD